MLFLSFPYLITAAKTTSTILNKYGQNGNLYLVPDLGGEAFGLSLLIVM